MQIEKKRIGKVLLTISMIIFMTLAILPTQLLAYSQVEHSINGISIAPQVGAKYGGTLVCHTPGDPQVLNPIITGVTVSHNILGQIFNQLVKYDENWNLQGDLAESWTISDNGLIYTFKLHKNVKWHDGVPFTSKDVKFTYESIRDKKLVSSARFQIVDKIECPDDYTVVIYLKTPNSAFLAALVGYSLACSQIIPEHLYANTDINENPHNYDPIGTGPFKFVEWVKGSHITLEANKEYFEGSPYLDKIIFKIIPDINTAILAFEAGEIDYLMGPPSTEIPRLQSINWAEVYNQPTNTIYHMAINLALTDSPLTNKEVRQALYTAINRKSIVDNIIVYAVPAATCFAQGQTAYYDTEVAKMYPVEGDVTKANTMLDEAGYPRDASGKRFSISLWTTAGATDQEDACMAIKQWFGELGVETTVQTIESTTLTQSFWYKRDFETVVWGSGMGPDPDVIYTRIHSSQIVSGGKNAYSFNNSRVNELLDLGRSTPDPVKRAVYYSELQRIVMEELPFFPLWTPVNTHVWNKEFEGLPNLPNAFQYELNKVWWTEGFSPETISNAKAAIEKAESEGRTYGLEDAKTLYGQSESAFATGDYGKAATLSGEVISKANAAQSFIQFYGTTIAGVAILIIIVIAIAYKFIRR